MVKKIDKGDGEWTIGMHRDFSEGGGLRRGVCGGQFLSRSFLLASASASLILRPSSIWCWRRASSWVVESGRGMEDPTCLAWSRGANARKAAQDGSNKLRARKTQMRRGNPQNRLIISLCKYSRGARGADSPSHGTTPERPGYGRGLLA